MPKISIIVPIYKVEPYLRRCIDSVMMQAYTDFELILVDDGSPDNCGMICDEYAKKDYRIRVIHQENGGVSTARNAGLRVAKGEYIAFCDSDDFLGQDWLNSLLACCCNKAMDLVSSGYTMCTENGVTIKQVKHKKEIVVLSTEQEVVDFLIHRVLLFDIGWEIWTKLFKREIIEANKIRFCETCNNFAEDMGFVMEYLLYCKTVFICDSTDYCYVKRENSMMQTSVEQVKLNALNEVSKQFGTRFLSRSNLEKKNHIFALIHFLTMKNQYDKAVELKRYQQLPKEINKVKDKDWYRRNTLAALSSYDLFAKHLGKPQAQKAMLLTSYCLHRKWGLHKYISAFFYKHVYFGE